MNAKRILFCAKLEMTICTTSRQPTKPLKLTQISKYSFFAEKISKYSSQDSGHTREKKKKRWFTETAALDPRSNLGSVPRVFAAPESGS